MTGANRALPFRLVDDDDIRPPYEMDTSLIQDSDSPLANAFAAAYIRPKRGDSAVNIRQPSFNRNIDCDSSLCDESREIIPVINEGRDTAPTVSQDYWISYLQAVFQLDEKGDFDSWSERFSGWISFGRTVGGLNAYYGSQVYLEHLREFREEAACSWMVPPHELGHQFGRQHIDARGIMPCCGCDYMGRYFDAPSLRWLRERGVNP